MIDFEYFRLAVIAVFAIFVYGVVAITLALENRK